MPHTSLRQLYENPDTTLSSGVGRAERQARMLAEIVAASDHLVLAVDVGCGDGTCTGVAISATAAVPNACLRVFGVDWSMAALKQAQRRGIPVVRASTEEGGLPIAASSVEVVIMSEIIEHLVDPDGSLDEAWRVLRPGGSLLLSTPNLAAWYNRVLLVCGIQPLFSEVSLRGIYGRPGSEVVGHLRLFTRRALKGLLEAIGFIDIELKGAPYHDVPGPLRPLDRLFCHVPSLSSNLLAVARKPT